MLRAFSRLARPAPNFWGKSDCHWRVNTFRNDLVYSSPVIIEVPHFASLRGKEREIIILRSDNGETWREHTLEASEEAVLEVLNASFDGENGTTNHFCGTLTTCCHSLQT